MSFYHSDLPQAQRRAKELLEQPLERAVGTEVAKDFLVAAPCWHVPMDKFTECWLNPGSHEESIVREPDPSLQTYTVRQALTAIFRHAFSMPLSDAIETRSLNQKDLDTITERSEEAKKLFEFAWALDDLAQGKEPNLSRLAEGLQLLKKMRESFIHDYEEARTNASNNQLLEQEHYRERAETIVDDCRDGKPIPPYIPDALKRKIKAEDFYENKTGAVTRLFDLIKANESITAADYQQAYENFMVSGEIMRSLADAMPSLIQQLQEIAINAGAVPVRARRGNGGPPSR